MGTLHNSVENLVLKVTVSSFNGTVDGDHFTAAKILQILGNVQDTAVCILVHD